MLPPAMHLRQAILDLQEPVKFESFQADMRGEKNPEFLSWDLDKFIAVLGDKLLPLRKGYNAKTVEPQWDIACPVEEMTLSNFIDTTKSGDDSIWRYFDYKYMSQWFENDSEFLKSIDWKRFGFDKDGNDSTLWIGSKGAHTNCHRDSYGCNLVAQIHGRKLWLLFPPDTGNSLKPIRVPYEESTIYSKFNFFCPTLRDEQFLMRVNKNARLVILEPGDVLLVPNGWWHYVESLDFSISINVWLPIDTDHKERIKEALVKLLVSQIGQGLPSVPEHEYNHEEAMRLIKICLDEYKQHNDVDSSISSTKKRIRLALWTAQDLANEYPHCVKLLPELSREKLREWLISNRERFADVKTSCSEADETLKVSIDVVNAVCNYDVINKIADLLLQED